VQLPLFPSLIRDQIGALEAPPCAGPGSLIAELDEEATAVRCPFNRLGEPPWSQAVGLIHAHRAQLVPPADYWESIADWQHLLTADSAARLGQPRVDLSGIDWWVLGTISDIAARFEEQNTSSAGAPGGGAGAKQYLLAEISSAALSSLQSSLDAAIREREEIASLPLEDALRLQLTHLLKDQSELRRETLFRRWGLHGAGVLTLEGCGDLLGITRERVRQLEARTLERASALTAPQAELLVGQLRRALPIAVAELDEVALSTGLVGKRHTASSLKACLELAGIEWPFVVKDETLFDQESLSEYLDFVSVTRSVTSAVRPFGLATRLQISDKISATGSKVDVREALTFLNAHDLGANWWFIPTANPSRTHPLTKVLQKLIVVSGERVAPNDFAEAVGRRVDFYNKSNGADLELPTAEVLISACRQLDEIEVVDTGVELTFDARISDPTEILSEIEWALVDIVNEQPGSIVDRPTLISEAEVRGLNLDTVSVYSTYGPILKRVARSVWGLRGVPVDQQELAALQAEM